MNLMLVIKDSKIRMDNIRNDVLLTISLRFAMSLGKMVATLRGLLYRGLWIGDVLL